MNIKGKTPQVSVDAKPLQPLWDAIALKQDKIKDSDDIEEGIKHCFYSPDIISSKVQLELNKIKMELLSKEDKIVNSDDIKEGPHHQFFSQELVYSTVLKIIEPHFKALEAKQNSIKSTDDIAEGSKKYWDEQRLESVLSKVVLELQTETDKKVAKLAIEVSSIFDRISKEKDNRINLLANSLFFLQNKPEKEIDISSILKDIEDLKAKSSAVPIQQPEIQGGDSRTLAVVVDIKDGKPVHQKIEIRGGRIARIFPIA